MTEQYFKTTKRLVPLVRSGDIEACEHEVAKEMRALDRTPFHIVLDLSITNDPAEAARHFDRFFREESKRLQIRAAYTEMNGFDINPDRWFCDQFAYEQDGGHDDYDWLADWPSEEFENYQIKGLEQLQSVYASDAFRENAYRNACYMCHLMVIIKFQKFIQRSAVLMQELRFPLYVTAHDSDFIAVVGPGENRA